MRSISVKVLFVRSKNFENRGSHLQMEIRTVGLSGIRDGKPDRKLGLSLLLKVMGQLFFFAYKINSFSPVPYWL